VRPAGNLRVAEYNRQGPDQCKRREVHRRSELSQRMRVCEKDPLQCSVLQRFHLERVAITSFYIVQKMREGTDPQAACDDCMRYMAHTAPNVATDQYCVIEIDPRGRTGAALMNTKEPLTCAVWRDGVATMQTAKATFYRMALRGHRRDDCSAG